MFVVNDLLDEILLGCFFFGIVFSGLSLFLGVTHFGLGHDGGHSGHGHPLHNHASDDVMSPITVGSILAFVTWFGGVAYLARNGAGLFSVASLALGLIAGFAGGYVVYWLLKKVRAAEAGLLVASEYHMPGTIGHVSSSIRAGGTGEIVYERRGVRQVSPARSISNEAIPRGAEVVVHHLASGIAFVEPSASFFGDRFEELAVETKPRVVEVPTQTAQRSAEQ
jgi:hypothetical protein